MERQGLAAVRQRIEGLEKTLEVGEKVGRVWEILDDFGELSQFWNIFVHVFYMVDLD